MSSTFSDSVVFDPHRPIGDITGEFFVPAYQRGYRWTADDVTRLLDDIEQSRLQNKDKPYTLQPIVVRSRKPKEAPGVSSVDQWELIDGQQRLTTLYLIFLVMRDKGWKKNAARYSLIYETRQRWDNFSSEVLANAENNIDFFHLSQAYETIENWFARFGDDYLQELRANALFDYLNCYVKVIWYEPLTNSNLTAEESEQEAIALFTRLNVGRIPLTDAELVKALLLTTINTSNPERAHEIAAQWDSIERDLQRGGVWAFITGLDETTTSIRYPTRINLLLDTLSDKDAPPPQKRKRYQTFETLRAEIEEAPKEFWNAVTELHAQIMGWMEDARWHNKIGYLIAADHQRFDTFIKVARNRKKSDFDQWLSNAIRNAIDLTKSRLSELSYLNANDKERLLDILLLFNVETLTRSNQFFPFAEHTGETWSLEHIHAQHSEGMNKEEQWRTWLRVQLKALHALTADANSEEKVQQAKLTISKITHCLAQERLDGTTFAELHAATVPLFGFGNTDHSIRNLALLSCRDNSELNNAVFEAKRQIILDRDRHGKYVPICTRHVFLKYYAISGNEQLHFWSDSDKNAYFDALTDETHGIGKYLRSDSASHESNP
jgi:hypothetical protein